MTGYHERMEDDEVTGRLGHEWRYRLAAGFIEPSDVVLDAACGTGYGRALMQVEHWIGVDRIGPVQGNLEHWQPDFPFDVGVSFETVEHLRDYDNLFSVLKQARKFVLASVPIVPTVGENPWHFHDFELGELPFLFCDEEWGLYQSVIQTTEQSEVCVFHRK